MTTKQRARENAEYIKQIKAERGCVDCGFGPQHPRWHPDVIEFDHKPEHAKFRELSNMTGYSIQRIAEEIAKCDTVCANCHRLRTALRRQSNTESTEATDQQLKFDVA